LTLYVANEGQADGADSSVSVIDARSLKLKAKIVFDHDGPVYAIASPDGKYLWVALQLYNFNTGGCKRSGVAVVSLATLKIETTLSLPQCPTSLVFSRDGKFAYVQSVDGPVSVIDTAARKIVARIKVSTGQYDLALSPDGRRLYATDAGDSNITVIDTKTNKPLSQIALNSAPFNLVLTPDGKRAFVWTESTTDSFEEINLHTGDVLAQIPPEVGTLTNGLAITPNGKLLYDVDYSAQTVWIYNTHTQSQIGSIAPFSYPIGIALSPDGERAYVTNNNCAAFPCTSLGYVTVLSTRTHAVLGTVNAGINPQFITVFPRTPN
jgi:YVTN family beta-propeller protein